MSAGGSDSAAIDAARRYAERHVSQLEWLDDELPNLLGAAAVAAEIGESKSLIELMRRLAVEASFFEARGYSPEALELLKTALNVARTHGEASDTHYFATALGNAYRQYFRQYNLAFAAYSDALELARLIPDPVEAANREARMLAALGTTRFHQGAGDSDTYYDRASALATERGDDDAMAVVLNHRSYYEGQKSPPDFERARNFSDQAVQLAIRRNMPEFHFSSLLNRASAERELGQLQTALATDRAAYQLAQTHNNRLWMADALWAIGEDHHALEDRAEAQRAFDASMALWRQSGATDSADELREFMLELGYTV